MNIFQRMFALTSARKRKRTCGKCGHRQTVPLSKAQQAVTCERCGNPVPPPRGTG